MKIGDSFCNRRIAIRGWIESIHLLEPKVSIPEAPRASALDVNNVIPNGMSEMHIYVYICGTP